MRHRHKQRSKSLRVQFATLQTHLHIPTQKKKTGVPILLCCFMVSSAVLQVHLSPGIKLNICQNICTAWIDMTWADFSRGVPADPNFGASGWVPQPDLSELPLLLCCAMGEGLGTELAVDAKTNLKIVMTGSKNSHQNQYQHRNCLEQIVVFFWNCEAEN